jgi:hypothetical protein
MSLFKMILGSQLKKTQIIFSLGYFSGVLGDTLVFILQKSLIDFSSDLTDVGCYCFMD